MNSTTRLFIGWSAQPPQAGRRLLLSAGVALAAGGLAGASIVFAGGRVAIGDGVWDMGQQHTLRGVLSADPFPLLRTPDLGGGVRTVFLATKGKAAASLPLLASGRSATVTGTLITRGRHAMLAVEGIEVTTEAVPGVPAEAVATDQGEVLLTGEILDAKCWFGAMRPGYGKAHKACAALCARGGMPLAFCRTDECGSDTEAPLFVDENGRAHSPRVLPWVADPVFVLGRLVRVGDVMQLRVALADIQRLK